MSAWWRGQILDTRWCCYITLDFATAASQNGVCVTQETCPMMVLFPYCYKMNKESNKQNAIFLEGWVAKSRGMGG
jgi:hypothetical protein